MRICRAVFFNCVKNKKKIDEENLKKKKNFKKLKENIKKGRNNAPNKTRKLA